MGDVRATEMLINQGDVYWIHPVTEHEMEPRVHHPHVIIQDDSLNHDPLITTVSLCALTTNARKISMPGNILLDEGEASLPRQSIVEVAKIVTVAKTQLGEYIGSISENRILQILDGNRFVEASFLNR